VKSRWPTRLAVLSKAFSRKRAERRPAEPREILVVAPLLIGDALLLAPLLAKLRARYPQATLRMTMARAAVPLFAGRPYGVEAGAYDPREAHSVRRLAKWPPADLALVPGDNRFSWLAAGLGARWIVAFSGDRPAYKSWPVDEQVAFPQAPAAWHDIAATLVEGPPPASYKAADWAQVPCASFERPSRRYAVLHVEASRPEKHWSERKWLELAGSIHQQGLQPIWSAGSKGLDLIRRIDPDGKYEAVGHKLDVAQLWNLVAGAALLVCPDTGISHMGKLTAVPTVTLYGPGSARLFGRGEFWRDAPFREITDSSLPARTPTLFKRRVASPQEDAGAGAASVAEVLAAARAIVRD
jgi:ADP-heptose:LPS heptosyltransferase